MTKKLSEDELVRRKAVRDAARLPPEECRKRQAEAKKRWFENNPGYLAEYKRKKRQENPEKARKIARDEYHANAENRRASCRKWWSSNSEKQKERLVNWKYQNPVAYAEKIIRQSTGVDKDQIPRQLIAAKIEQLKVTWLLKGVSCEIIE